MAWHLSDDVDRFAAAAGDFLRSRPVEHTVPLTLVDTLRSRGPHAYGPEDPIFAWWSGPDGTVRGAALRTPPHPMLVLAVPDAAGLVALLADRALPAVNVADGSDFVSAWCAHTGATAVPGPRSRLYRLDVLAPPSPAPPGAARPAAAPDRPLLVSWMDEFQAEIGEAGAVRDTAEMVDDRLSYDGFTLWEVDQSPVSMAGHTRPEAGMVRVAPVYTPPAFRGHGYAAGATAAVTQAAIDAGAADVVLFTDLANPTSNALYQRLGYRPIEDRTVVEFVS